MVPPAAGVQEPADNFQLNHSHSTPPEQLLQCSADSTVPETMYALSYVSSYSRKKKKKLLTPSVARRKF